MIFKKSLIAVTALTVVVICLGIDANAQSSKSKFDEYGRWINGVSEPWFMRNETSQTTRPPRLDCDGKTSESKTRVLKVSGRETIKSEIFMVRTFVCRPKAALP